MFRKSTGILVVRYSKVRLNFLKAWANSSSAGNEIYAIWVKKDGQHKRFKASKAWGEYEKLSNGIEEGSSTPIVAKTHMWKRR